MTTPEENKPKRDFNPFRTAAEGGVAVAKELLPGLDRVTQGSPTIATGPMNDAAGPESLSGMPVGQEFQSAAGVGVTATGEAVGTASPHEEFVGSLSVSDTGRSSWDQFGAAKSTGGGMKVELEGTLGAPVDPRLYAEQYAIARKSAMIKDLGHQARSNALGIMIDIERDYEHAWRNNFEKTNKEIDAILTEAEEETNALGEYMERVKADRVNPGQFFANIGGSGRFAAAMAVAAGSMATAFGGGPNVAYGIIKQSIDNNVRAQITNQRHNVQAAYAQMNFINTLKGLANTKQNYAHYLRMGLAGMAQSQVAQAQMGFQQAQAQLAGQDVWNRLEAMIVDSKIQAQTALQSKAKFKLTSLAEISQVQSYIESTRGGGQATKALAAGGKRGGGQQADTGGGGATGVLENISSAINDAKTRGKPMSDSQIAGRVVNLLRGGKKQVSKEMVDQVAGALESGGLMGAANKLREVEPVDFQPEEVAPRQNLHIGGLGDVSYVITDPAAWDAKGKSLQELKQKVKAPLVKYAKSKRLYDLLGAMNAGADGMARYFRKYHSNLTFTPTAAADIQKSGAEMRLLREDLMEAIRQSENTRNALNLKHEIERYEIRTGAGVSFMQQIFDTLSNSPGQWQAKMRPALDNADAGVRELEYTSGIRFIRDYAGE